MTPTDDDVIARLRASLKATADRTPIGAGRSLNVAARAEQSPARRLVPAISAAAAAAAVVGVAAVVANAQSGGHRGVQSGAGAPGVSVASSASAVATPPAKPTPVASAVNGSAVPTPSPGACVPENYYVTASPAEVAGLTYMLPATPAGYVLYGAWGTISRNLCADSVTWYVEYEPVGGTPGSGAGSFQLTVTKVGDHADGDSNATPIAATPVRIGDVEGSIFVKDGSYALIGWATGGAQIALAGPVSHGDVGPLVQVATSVVLVNPGDPRIVAPANCQVPPGSVCGSDSPTPTPTITPTPISTPTSTFAVTSVPTPTPTAR